MSFADHLRRDLRLVLLRLLVEANGGANVAILDKGVTALGHRVSREQIEQELAYLASLDAVQLETAGRVTLVTLKRRGRDHVDRRGPPLVGVDLPSD